MSKRLTGLPALAYMGVEASTPPQMYLAKRAPTISDSRNFNIGDLWLDEPNESLYVLASLARGEATWVATFGGAANNFITDNGTATDNNGSISIIGDGITTETEATGSGLHEVTVKLTSGSDGQLIIGDSNAPAEWATVTSADNSVVIAAGPHSLDLTVDASVVVGNGTNGQLLIGGGSAPAWASLTSDGSIIITPGANTLQITAPNATGVTTLGTDSGTATQAAGNIDVVGDGVTIETSGAGDTATISMINGTDGQLLIGGGANPVWANLTSTGLTVTITNAANSINLEATGVGAGASQFDTDGASATEAAGVIEILGGNNIVTSGAGNTVTIDLNGTTNHALQVGNASGSLTSLAAATNGQIPIGRTGLDPALSTLTAGSGISIVNGSGSITISAAGGGSGTVIVTTYDTPGTFLWAANVDTKYVEVYGWNGGGGGGGGGQGNTTGNGGSGAAAGSAFYLFGPAQLFGTTATVTVGAGGTGGTGAATPNTTGGNGTAGGQSRFGNAIAPLTINGSISGVTGNNYGSGGMVNTAGVTKGGGYAGLFSMMSGNIYDYFTGSAASSATNKVPYGGDGGSASFSNGSNGSTLLQSGGQGSTNFYVFTYMLPTGGGGGSPWNNSGAFDNPGGNGGDYYAFDGTTVIGSGGLGGQNAGAPDGANGSDLPTSGGMIFGGTGGGGGKGRFGGSTPGNGGDGGQPGGGGGGGGGAQNGVAGGDGGNGGDGMVIVIEWT